MMNGWHWDDSRPLLQAAGYRPTCRRNIFPAPPHSSGAALDRSISRPHIGLNRHAAATIDGRIAECRRLGAIRQYLQPLQAFADHRGPMHASAQLLVVPVIGQASTLFGQVRIAAWIRLTSSS